MGEKTKKHSKGFYFILYFFVVFIEFYSCVTIQHGAKLDVCETFGSFFNFVIVNCWNVIYWLIWGWHRCQHLLTSARDISCKRVERRRSGKKNRSITTNLLFLCPFNIQPFERSTGFFLMCRSMYTFYSIHLRRVNVLFTYFFFFSNTW